MEDNRIFWVVAVVLYYIYTIYMGKRKTPKKVSNETKSSNVKDLKKQASDSYSTQGKEYYIPAAGSNSFQNISTPETIANYRPIETGIYRNDLKKQDKSVSTKKDTANPSIDLKSQNHPSMNELFASKNQIKRAFIFSEIINRKWS